MSSTQPPDHQTLTVSTTSDLPTITSGTYNVPKGGQVSQPTVTLVTPPSSGARSEYMVAFATSSPNRRLSNLALSQITVTFPADGDITTSLGNTFDRTVTANNASVGGCSQSGVVATCGLFGGRTIPAGHQLEVESTDHQPSHRTPDPDGLDHLRPPDDHLRDLQRPERRTGLPAHGDAGDSAVVGRALGVHGRVRDLVAEPEAVEPGAEPDHGHVPGRQRHHASLGNTSDRTVTANNASVGGCSQSGVVATCGLFGGRTIPAGHQLKVESTDHQPNHRTPDAHGLDHLRPSHDHLRELQRPERRTGLPAHGDLVTPPSSGARSEYMVEFTTSSPNRRLSNLALSQITVTFPADGDITTSLGNTFDRTVTANNASVGGCSQSGEVATCSLNGGQTIPGGHQLEIEFDGVINPAAGPQTLSVKTTSDLPATASGTYNIQTGGQISQPAVTLSNHAPARGRPMISWSLHDLVAERDAVEPGAEPDHGHVPDRQRHHDSAGEHVRQGRDREQRDRRGVQPVGGGRDLRPLRRPHDPLRPQLSRVDGITNPSTASSTGAVSVRTTSDLPQGTSADYTIGGNPPPPTVTSISPSSGPGAGGTLVTINGANFTGATVVFGPRRPRHERHGHADDGCLAGWLRHGRRGRNERGWLQPISAADRFTYASSPPPPPASSAPAVSGAAPTSQTSTGAGLRLGQPGEPVHDRVLPVRPRSSYRGPGASHAV